MSCHCTYCSGHEVVIVNPDAHNAALVFDAAGRGLPLWIAGVKYVPETPPEVTYTDAEASAMRLALKRLDRKQGR